MKGQRLTASRSALRIAAGTAVLAAALALAGCSSSDSTATGKPSTTNPGAPATTAPVVSTEGTAGGNDVAATAPPEQPQPVPSGFPGPTDTQIDARGQKFLDALKAAGVTVNGTGDIAISTANYICAAKRDNIDPAAITTIVKASVGSGAVASGASLTDDQAAALAQKYIDTASSAYCS